MKNSPKILPAGARLWSRLLLFVVLAAGVSPFVAHATPITASFSFNFDTNTFDPGETPVIGQVTITLNAVPASAGYTSNGTVDALSFNIPNLGLTAASTNYVKMLFDSSGHMTYLLVSDRSDFELSALSPKKAGYILGLKATDLLSGTGFQIGSSFGSYFDYYLDSRRGVDVAYSYTVGSVAKIANPVHQPASVPDTPATAGLLGATVLGLFALRRRAAA